MAHSKPTLQEKPCVHCQKPMVWRKAWRNCWETVKYCSTACQRQANREARRLEPTGPQEDNPKKEPALLTQRFNRPRKVLAIKKR